MRIGRQESDDGRLSWVEIRDDGAYRLGDGEGWPPPAAGSGSPVAVEGRPVAPVVPGKIVAIGLNYADHVRETGMDTPSSPLIFAKFPNSLSGPEDPIVVDPLLTERVDWEVELAVVIGTRARRVAVADALGHVFGYSVANDVSARDLQLSEGQWVRGKSLDTFCPVGPVLVTAEEVPDPQALELSTTVNGETVQAGTTADMIFGVAELISFCSHSFTLEPGDLILTGTPWGCGEFMDPRRSLAVGDLVRCEVSGIGAIENRVEAPAGATG
jgi:2-keto-4-pentenoate hydratase/2-oxohepta-3-ene-1,7-dioic acid hydratase in catechol pathway